MKNIIEETMIQDVLEEARELNKIRVKHSFKSPPITARTYFTDALISIDAFAIASLLAEPSPCKRWVEKQTSLAGTPLIRCYEKRWSVGLVGMEVCPVYLGGYMPEEKAQQKADEYNEFLNGE